MNILLEVKLSELIVRKDDLIAEEKLVYNLHNHKRQRVRNSYQ